MTGPYDRVDVEGDEAVRLDKWQGPWTNQKLTRVIVWLVFKVPHDPVKGFHVAPQDWFVGLYKIICVNRVRTMDRFHRLRLRIDRPTIGPWVDSCHMNVFDCI
jgi:hypothetical protein